MKKSAGNPMYRIGQKVFINGQNTSEFGLFFVDSKIVLEQNRGLKKVLNLPRDNKSGYCQSLGKMY